MHKIQFLLEFCPRPSMGVELTALPRSPIAGFKRPILLREGRNGRGGNVELEFHHTSE